MNVKSLEKKENSSVEMLIAVDHDIFEAAIEKAYRKNRGRFNVPGFRKGKAPRKIIEGMFGVSVFYEDAINDTCYDAYEQAVAQEKLDVVSHPKMEMDKIDGEGYSFRATVTVRPEAVIKEYKGLTATKETVKVGEKDVKEELKRYIDQATRLVTAQRAAQKGDTVVLDYEGFTGEPPVAFEGGKAEGHELSLGSNSFIPGFEDQLVGMSAGDEGEIQVTFPEQYHAEALAGKPATFKVKINEVKEPVAPEVDDEFAKDVSEFETLKDFKKHLKEELTKRREEETKRKFESAVMEALVANLECEIPDPMVDYQLDKMIDDYARSVQSQGLDFDTYLGYMGMTVDMIREQSRGAALNQVRSQLALDAVADAEGLEVPQERVDEMYAKLSSEGGMTPEKVKELVDEAQMRRELRREMALELVRDSAQVAPEEEKPAAKKSAKAKEPEEDTAAAEKPAKKTAKKEKTEE